MATSHTVKVDMNLPVRQHWYDLGDFCVLWQGADV